MMANWHGIKGMWVDRMLNTLCDFQLWPKPWPWPWIFKVKKEKESISLMLIFATWFYFICLISKHVMWELPGRWKYNDNTPQPLVQWTNSPFTGQQVGNCKSFTLTHYLADLFVMLRGPRSIPLCIQHHIQLTSLSFQVSETSHCWVTAISIFNLENLRSRSWVRSKFEVTMWV